MHRTAKRMCHGWVVKILEIPRARQRIMHSTPVLLLRVSEYFIIKSNQEAPRSPSQRLQAPVGQTTTTTSTARFEIDWRSSGRRATRMRVLTIDRKCLDKRTVSKTDNRMGLIDIAATPARGGYSLKFLERNSSASVMMGDVIVIVYRRPS